MENTIEQGKFYRIQYLDTGESNLIELTTPVKIGQTYNLKGSKRRFLVLSQAKFKYTYEDIDNIRVLMSDYDRGSIQYRLRVKMENAFKQPTPSVSFNDDEREVLGYVYYDRDLELTDKQKATLRKVLGLKRNE